MSAGPVTVRAPSGPSVPRPITKGQKATTGQKLIFLQHVQSIELEDDTDVIEVSYANETPGSKLQLQLDSASAAKRLFYDILKEVRANGKVLDA